MTETVLMEREGAIAVLTLNRPDKLNALNYQMNDRLIELLDVIEDDSTVRAVILTGAAFAGIQRLGKCYDALSY